MAGGFNRIVFHCLDDGVRGEPFGKLVLPERRLFVLKQTLRSMNKSGCARTVDPEASSRRYCGNNCVLSPNDAYMRDFKLFIPANCVVSEKKKK